MTRTKLHFEAVDQEDADQPDGDDDEDDQEDANQLVQIKIKVRMLINLCNSSSDTCSPISHVSLVISTLCSCRKERQEDQNIKGKSSEYT